MSQVARKIYMLENYDVLPLPEWFSPKRTKWAEQGPGGGKPKRKKGGEQEQGPSFLTISRLGRGLHGPPVGTGCWLAQDLHSPPTAQGRGGWGDPGSFSSLRCKCSQVHAHRAHLAPLRVLAESGTLLNCSGKPQVTLMILPLCCHSCGDQPQSPGIKGRVSSCSWKR